MSDTATTPSAVFAMRTSVFNDFLYAPVGEEDNGMILTALSALARLGVDPWDEAARLAALPRDAALKRLTAIVAGAPHGRWAASAVSDIAARLTALLPASRVADTQLPATALAKSRPSAMIVTVLIVFFVNAVALTVLRHHEPQPSAGQSTTAASGAAINPEVPVP